MGTKNQTMVGIFFVVGDKLISHCTPLENGSRYGDFINYSSHWDVWLSLQEKNPVFRQTEYDEFPRGRVVYNTARNKSVIYIDKKLYQAKYLNMILIRFQIRSGQYEIGFDEHYSSLKMPYDKII